MAESKKIYSYAEERKAIAFIDILGFSSLTSGAETSSRGEFVFTLFENCVLKYQDSMLTEFKRDVPPDLDHAGNIKGFWYEYIKEGAVNFIYASDCLVLYSASLQHLINELSAIFGSAIVWGVPLRAGVALGGVFHGEYTGRPGMAISLVGSGLTRAVELEKQSGKGMRVFLSDEVTELTIKIGLSELVVEGNSEIQVPQLRWWRGARLAVEGKPESEQLRFHFDRWFEGKEVSKWFRGPHLTDTKSVIDKAVEDLKSINR